MKTMYEVIWIDDEWEKMDAFKEECEVIHHIHLQPFETQKAGMDEFDKNPKKWDAIILDAKLEKDGVGVEGLRKAVTHINQMTLSHKVPYFISTGQPDLMSNETFEQSFGKFYIKEQDDSKLIADIKEQASKSTRFQVKMYYSHELEQVFLLKDDIGEDILTILEVMHFPNSHPDFIPRLYYNPMRKALEYVFRSANEIGIIPDAFFPNGIVNLNQCFMYLIGRDAEKIGCRYGNVGEAVVPRHIHDVMSLIINLGNVSSHSTEQSHHTELSEDEIQEYDNFIKTSGVNSRILLFSIALQFCEIVQWMNNYKKENPNINNNLEKCKPIAKDKDASESFKGKINKDKNRIYFSSNYIIDKSKGFKEGSSPQEYEYKENEEVLFELRKTTNPKTGFPFSFARNVRPVVKSKS